MMRESWIVREKEENVLGLCRFVIFGCLLLASSSMAGSFVDERYPSELNSAPMHMVLLTQKDYIQFLRWQLPVPKIEEFTFCLWLRSNDLTHPHSIFSYSLNEKKRLVRAWISERGKNVHLEIGGTEIFRETISLKENRWYHVCQSWENRQGRFAMWLDGRVKAQGYAAKTVSHVIPSGGDIVLGQEYTDFDKGLEEGIEGAVFGFNLLLKSAFEQDNDLPGEPVYPPMISSYYSNGIPRFVSTRTTRPYFREKNSLSFPLGLQLIKQSYVRCELGRGSPRIGGSSMLISWSRTPVRVFGGATLKNARKDCGHF